MGTEIRELSKEGAYTAAERLDRIITEMWMRRPITANSAINWLDFTRTVRTTLDVIDAEARNMRAARKQEPGT